MLDLAIVGSGPCALALVSRLACPEEADASADFIFGFDSVTEPLRETQRRLAGLRGGRLLQSGRVKVFDSTGRWMGKWNDLFSALGIQHLRSPHTAHPSPTHALALLAHAETLPQDDKAAAFADFNELQYRGCHRAPSAALLRSLCDALCDAQQLDGLLEQAIVTAIEPVFASEGAANNKRVSHFRLMVRRGDSKETTVVEARAVVVAAGSTSCPRVPDWVPDCLEAATSATPPPAHSLRHAWDLPRDLVTAEPVQGKPSNDANAPLQPHERVLVIGGGLTAIQMAMLAADQGCREVHLAARRPLRMQQFDFAAAWMDRRHRPRLLRRFLQTQDTAERRHMLQEARGLSSVPPEAYATLRQAEEEGRVTLWESAEVSSASPPAWDGQARAWRVVLEHYDAQLHRVRRIERWFERVWCATGSDIRLDRHPLLAALWDKCPIPTSGGLPCLTPHLAWSEDCELYVLGAPAALVLGPDSGNLMGSRTGAARAAHVLKELVQSNRSAQAVEQAKREVAGLRFRYDGQRQYVKGPGLGQAVAAAAAAARRDRSNRSKGCGCC